MRKIIDKVIEIMCTAIMGFMVIAVCWQVFTRFVLKNPSTTTEEILRYMLVWTTMVGGAYAYGRRKHLSINMLTKKFSPRGQTVMDIIVQVIVILFCSVVIRTASANAVCICQYPCRRYPDGVLCTDFHLGRYQQAAHRAGGKVGKER